MNCLARLALTGSVWGILCATPAFAQTPISQHTDSSGKITIGIFEENSGPGYQHAMAVDVPEPWVVVGGGVETRVGVPCPPGCPTPYSADAKHLVVTSRPNDSLSSWDVFVKSHHQYNFAPVRAWAIALKIQGLTRAEVLGKIVINVSASPVASHPDVSVGVPSGYLLIGGGFMISSGFSNTIYNFGTASYPDTPYTWRAKSKDHINSHPASTRVYAVGLQQYIEGVGNIAVMTASASSPSAQHPSSYAGLTPGYALTGCGAWVQWTGAGNLLTKIKPATSGGLYGCEGASKDVKHYSPAVITTYATGITVY